jgi:hypothetical protein
MDLFSILYLYFMRLLPMWLAKMNLWLSPLYLATPWKRANRKCDRLKFHT